MQPPQDKKKDEYSFDDVEVHSAADETGEDLGKDKTKEGMEGDVKVETEAEGGE